MSKHYFLKVGIIPFLLLTWAITAKAQVVYALHEGFETGIPNTWTQEYVFGNTSWTVEQGGSFPSGSAEGSMRAVLRNNTQQTQNFVTKLVSPIMNLSKVYQPILIFSHAQEQQLGDVDQLQVYYRSSTTTPWVLLKDYSNRIRSWAQDTIKLVGVTATYQIAFQGKDKFGRGIVLDNVRVRPMPVCTQPAITVIAEAKANSFDLYWSGSFDADSFAVKISKTRLTDIELASDLALDTIVQSFSCSVKNLDVNTTYYCYVKSFCLGEESPWSDAYAHRTQASVVLPHTEKFNMAYNAGVLNRLSSWTWKNSWPDAQYNYSPHINTNIAASSLGNYSRTGTTCVVFTGSNNSTTAIPAGQWAYITTPQIIIDSIQKVQISFWGSAYTYLGSEYAASLIVGIMTDPEDIETFVPIDTVSINSTKTFEEFIIPFNSYTGNGKYIAFLSNFKDKTNIFYVDDVTIELIPDCQKITGVKALNVSPTSAVLKWNAAITASAYKVIVASEQITNVSQIDPTKVVFTTLSNTNSCQIPVNTLESWKKYYVYVQAACADNTGAWSNEYSFQTPCAGSLPMYYTFEPSHDGTYQNGSSSTNIISNCLYAKSQHTVLPYNYNTSTYALQGTYSLWMIGYPDSKAYVSFPALDSLSNVRVTFFAKTSSASYVGSQSIIEIGVLSDINDYSSFVSLDTIVGQVDYNRYRVDFSKYKGNGKNIAIAVSSLNTGMAYVNVDNLTIEAIPECLEPTTVTVEPGVTTAQLNWNSTGANSYRVKISPVSIADSINNETASVIDTIVNTNSFLAEKLLPNRVRYYYYVKSICTDTVSHWTYEESFKTTCQKRTIPFSENFESYTSSSSSDIETDMPNCWDFNYYMSGVTQHYPYISTNTGYFPNGSKCLYFYSPASTNDQYAILPEFAVDSIQLLQLSFMLRQSSVNYLLEVGAVTDNDISTFNVVDSVRATVANTGITREINVDFSKYHGPGNRIAYRVNYDNNTNYAYIDNILVEYAGCIKPKNLHSRDVSNNQAILEWDKGSDETKWDLLVLQYASVVNPDTVTKNIIFHAAINTQSYTLSGLQDNTQYTFYLRSICGEDTTAWTFVPGRFRTTCITKTVGELGSENFENYATGTNNFVGCWETGIQLGTNYLPYVLSNSNSKRLYFNDGSSSDGIWAVMPPIEIDNITRLKVKLNAYTASTNAANQKKLVVGIITNTSDLASFVPVDTIEVEYNNPQDYTINFSAYKGDYNGDYGKRVMFISSFGEEAQNYVYIDNVQLDTISSCQEPTKVWADSIGTYGAHISWDGKSSGSYRVKISTEKLSAASLRAPKIISNIIICDSIINGVGLAINNLKMLKKYYMYVQSICSASDSSEWSNERFFSTICPPTYTLPYSENFDNYGTETTTATTATLPCWNRYYGSASSQSTTLYPYINGSYNNTVNGVGGLYFSTSTANYYAMAVSPALSVNNISKTQLSFYAKNYSSVSTTYLGSKLIVGLTANPDSLTLDSFTPIDTICIGTDQTNPVSNQWYKYQYDLSSFSTDTLAMKYKHLVFVMDRQINVSSTGTVGATGYMAIDDVELTLIPTCQKPDNLKIANKTEASISVTWEDQFASSSWNVQYGPKGFVLGTGTIISSDTTNSSISALSPNTTYDIYVQSNCGIEDGTSLWVGPLTVTTLAVPVTQFPYLQGFEDNTENSKWQFEQGTIVNQWNIGASIAKTGNKSLYISNDNGLKPQYTITNASSGWAYRTLVLEPGMYTVSFDWNCYGESTLDYIRAGFLPATSIFTSATTAGTVKDADGTTTTMGATSATTPKSWIGLEGNGLYKLNLIDTVGVDIKWNNAKSTVIITDEQAGYYNLVFYWRNDASTGKEPNPSALIDNIIIEKVACPIPIQIKTDYVLDTLGQVSWNKLGADQTSWNIKVLNKELSVDALQNIPDSLVVLSTITDTTVYQIHGLKPQTPYFIYVSANCSDTTSFWIKHSFTTACTPSVVNTLWTFEENNNHQTSTSASYLAPDCWVVGNKNSTSYTYIPFKIKDGSTTSLAGTGTNTYSRSNGLGTALRIYSTTTYNGAYAIMPAYNGDMDTLQLHFQARAAYAAKAITTGQGYKISTTYASSTYAHSIIVGTVTDQSDISTFVPLDTVILNTRTTSEYANEANNWLFDEIVIPLGKAKGKYVTLLSEFDKANYVYIDDISIEKIAGCFTPKNLSINSITSSTAQVKWDLNGEGGTAWVIKVAKDKDLNNVIVTDTTYSHSPYQINNLKPGTTYYVAVQQLCSAGEFSDWSVVNEFETARTLIYKENFDAFRHNPASWYRLYGGNKFIDDEILTSSFSINSETVTASTGAWVHNSGNNGLKGDHQYLTIYASSVKELLVSPTVEIPSEPTWLTFDLALTGYNTATPVIKNTDGDDDRFLVVISEDGGVSWKKTNITEWNNIGTGTYKFDSIANTGEKVKIDLSKYAGKDIRVAFYGESTAGASAVSDRRADIHIDNIQINRFVLDTVQTSLCPAYDYSDNHFNIPYDNLKTGINEYSKLILSSNNSIADSLITLKVTVSPLAKKIITATTCEGVEYTEFNFKSSLAGEYKQKLNTGNGCDSLVVLNLSVIPKIKVNVFDTICYGVPYVFNNIPYTRSGLYTATFQSKVTGCDSIVSLYLKVKDALRKELNETICYGESYTFGGKALNVSGTYTDTLQTRLGCDSIVTLKLIAKTQLSKKITDVVCKGNTYTGYGFVGVPAIAGDYTRIEKTADGCDSTIVLSLSVQDPETIIYRDTISVNELPYTFHGTTYPTGKAIGTYEVTTVDGFGGCKVIKAILTIQEETGLNNPFVYNLSVVPTIIQRGGSVQIMLDTEELTQGQLQIDVYNTIGVNVYSHKEVKKPVEINAFPSTGIYLIKLTTSTNKIMYGRVIVK